MKKICLVHIRNVIESSDIILIVLSTLVFTLMSVLGAGTNGNTEQRHHRRHETFHFGICERNRSVVGQGKNNPQCCEVVKKNQQQQQQNTSAVRSVCVHFCGTTCIY